MDTKLADVILHIDETVDHQAREEIQDLLRQMDGVMAADSHDEKPHLMVVGYDPDRTNSSDILKSVKDRGLHAELIGL